MYEAEKKNKEKLEEIDVVIWQKNKKIKKENTKEIDIVKYLKNKKIK